jgi:hypothetical protein
MESVGDGGGLNRSGQDNFSCVGVKQCRGGSTMGKGFLVPLKCHARGLRENTSTRIWVPQPPRFEQT